MNNKTRNIWTRDAVAADKLTNKMKQTKKNDTYKYTNHITGAEAMWKRNKWKKHNGEKKTHRAKHVMYWLIRVHVECSPAAYWTFSFLSLSFFNRCRSLSISYLFVILYALVAAYKRSPKQNNTIDWKKIQHDKRF